MKSSIAIAVIATLASSVGAAPASDITPQGGSGSTDNSLVDAANIDWANIDYSKIDYSGVDWSKVDYSKVDYKAIDWDKVDYDGKGRGQWDSAAKIFTSSYSVKATPDQVVNGTGTKVTFTGGLKGACGTFNYGIIADANTICYRIELYGFRGEYQSLAKTATHIHEGAKCQNGPPRVVFPNPIPVEKHKPEGKRVSVGCLRGPFKTGIVQNRVDTGAGFYVGAIEKDPKNFFTDVHSSLAVPGAVRGQLA